MTHKIQFTIDFTPRIVRLLIVAVLVTSVAVELGSETLTMSTTYPSPAGIYRTIITTSNTDLARSGGTVTVGKNGTAILNIGSAAYPATLSVADGSITAGTLALTNALAPSYGGTGLTDSGTDTAYFLGSNGNHGWQRAKPPTISGVTTMNGTPGYALGTTYTNSNAYTIYEFVTVSNGDSASPSLFCAAGDGAGYALEFSLAEYGASWAFLAFAVPPNKNFQVACQHGTSIDAVYWGNAQGKLQWWGEVD